MTKAYQAVIQHLSSKERMHSDCKVAFVSQGCFQATAMVAGFAAFKGFSILALGFTLAGVIGTASYCMHQMYLSNLYNRSEK